MVDMTPAYLAEICNSDVSVVCHMMIAKLIRIKWGGHLQCGTQQGDDAVGAWWERAPEQWHSGELLLACGATAVADLRAAVAAELSYSCSAGIAHNKVCSATSCLLPPGYVYALPAHTCAQPEVRGA